MGAISEAIEKFKVEPETALSLKNRFEPFEQQAAEWKENALKILVTDISETDIMDTARNERLKFRQVRLGVVKLHEELKADSLKKGQVLDTIKRTLVGMIEPIEAHLQQQEDFKVIAEAQRKAALLKDRMEAIKPYRTAGDGMDTFPFHDMNQDAFDTFIMGLKVKKEQRDAELVELDRVKKQQEQDTIAERKRIQEENDRLNKERAEMQARLKHEQEERTRLENIELDRKKKEELDLKERKLADRRAKRAPDKVKLLAFADRIQSLEPLQLKDEDALEVYNSALTLLAKVVKYINTGASNL